MTTTPLVGSTFFGLDVSALVMRLRGFRRQVSKRFLLLEFEARGLKFAEARFSGAGLQMDHATRLDLPEEALDRGVPSEPLKMAALIKEVCREKKINVHRAVVVLPTETAFQRLIELPVELSPDQARAFVMDPASGLQIPVSLSQADFDLQPTVLPAVREASGAHHSYLLTALPRTLVDTVIETLQAADLELQALEIGSQCQLRLMALDLVMMHHSDVRLVLEFQTDCTHFTLVGASGPIRFERLAAIRDFPEPSLSEEQALSMLESGLAAEQIMIRQESYMALSELDLRVLFAEVWDVLRRFSRDWSGFNLDGIAITGPNSAHPLLPELLKAEFGCSVVVLDPILAHGVEGIQFDSVMVHKGLNRLVGLGLGLLPNDHLLSCSLESVSRPNVSTQPIPLVDVSGEPENSQDLDALPLVVDAKAEISETLTSVSSLATNPAASDDLPPVQSMLDEPQENRPEQNEEWPTIASLDPDPHVDSQVTMDNRSNEQSSAQDFSTQSSLQEEEEWPSIASLDLSSFSSVQPHHGLEGAQSSGELPELESKDALNQEVWPSISSLDSVDTAKSETAAHSQSQGSQVKPSSSPLGELKFSRDDE